MNEMEYLYEIMKLLLFIHLQIGKMVLCTLFIIKIIMKSVVRCVIAGQSEMRRQHWAGKW